MVFPLLPPGRWQRVPEQRPVDATFIRVGVGDEEPSVTVTYDDVGNVVHMGIIHRCLAQPKSPPASEADITNGDLPVLFCFFGAWRL